MSHAPFLPCHLPVTYDWLRHFALWLHLMHPLSVSPMALLCTEPVPFQPRCVRQGLAAAAVETALRNGSEAWPLRVLVSRGGDTTRAVWLSLSSDLLASPPVQPSDATTPALGNVPAVIRAHAIAVTNDTSLFGVPVIAATTPKPLVAAATVAPTALRTGVHLTQGGTSYVAWGAFVRSCSVLSAFVRTCIACTRACSVVMVDRLPKDRATLANSQRNVVGSNGVGSSSGNTSHHRRCPSNSLILKASSVMPKGLQSLSIKLNFQKLRSLLRVLIAACPLASWYLKVFHMCT